MQSDALRLHFHYLMRHVALRKISNYYKAGRTERHHRQKGQYPRFLTENLNGGSCMVYSISASSKSPVFSTEKMG
jgi:hypothetical protein